jgi:hypothetical protein
VRQHGWRCGAQLLGQWQWRPATAQASKAGDKLKEAVNPKSTYAAVFFARTSASSCDTGCGLGGGTGDADANNSAKALIASSWRGFDTRNEAANFYLNGDGDNAMTARVLLPALMAGLLTACVTKGEINDSFRRVDRVWQLEYQQTEDQYRYRVVDADPTLVIVAIRKTFIDLGLPVQGTSLRAGIVTAESTAPAPLSREEWAAVVKAENPRLKAIAGDMLQLTDDPKDYVITFSATVRNVKGKSFILLDYALDAPRLRRHGFLPSRHAPPLAVQYASIKFWGTLGKYLSQSKAPAPRRRSKQEIDA